MRAIFNWRYYFLFILGAIAFCGIFAMPNDDLGIGAWTFNLIISKLIGMTAGYFSYKLTIYWQQKGLIPELAKYMEDEE